MYVQNSYVSCVLYRGETETSKTIGARACMEEPRIEKCVEILLVAITYYPFKRIY